MNREKQWIMLDHFRRKMFLKYELNRFLLKGITKNGFLPFSFRYLAMYNKSKITRFSTLGVQRNRCILTGRVWNVLKKPQYSRFIFRTESYHGNMPGCKKASW